MRKYLVMGNWKMNLSKEEAKVLLENLKNTKSVPENVTLAVLPSFPYLYLAEDILADTKIAWGAQNFNDNLKGAFTGEVSLPMLKSFNATYALVGHSERRQYYHETDALIAKKFALALENGIKPVICIGETLEERESGHAFDVIKKQLAEIVSNRSFVEALVSGNAVIAYEPVWAIGTGKTATPKEAEEIHSFIRKLFASVTDKSAEIFILYGGSMKPSNAKELLAMPNINGGLIGGASLKAADFVAIAEAVCNF